MQNLSNDLAVITSTDKKLFDKLVQNANYCICDYLESMALNNENLCEIDIGIGTLKIKVNEDTVTYSFIPSAQLETNIINTLENQQNLLSVALDSTLVRRLNKLYDGLL